MGDQKFEFGLKVVDEASWLIPDAVNGYFGSGIPTGAEDQYAGGSNRISQLREVALSDGVPEEVRRLYAVAIGTMAYGWLYYPLYASGADRLFLALELSVRLKHEGALGTETRRRSLERRISWLCEGGHIEPDLCEALQLQRDGRNEAMHPSFQTVHHFGLALRAVRRTAALIERLASCQSTTPPTVKHHHLSPLDPRLPEGSKPSGGP